MKIIVLTPIRNEEWILNQFLQICSLFADHIIIADQNSTDNSREIARQFEKVILIKNDNENFNEAERQKLLIAKARELFGIGHLLLALDADEIITADSLNAAGWEKIKKGKPGTIFYFDKPTPLFDLPKALTYKKGFPLAYVDDGAKHAPSLIHSTRIPTPPNAKHIKVDDISFLHLCFIRKNIQFSKNRYYCVLENINNIRGLRLRRMIYSKYSPHDYFEENIIDLNEQWYNTYKEIGIELKEFVEDEYYYMDFEILRIFKKYGTKRFWKDPIWNFDWEKCRVVGINQGLDGIPLTSINKPHKLYSLILDFIFKILNYITNIKRRINI